MKKTAIAIGIMLAAAPLSSAWADSSENRDVEPFHKIVIDGKMDATITVGEEQSVVVTVSKEKYFDDITTTVKDGMLTVDMDKKGGLFSVFKKIDASVAITVPSLDYLVLDGMGNVKAKGIDSEDFYLMLDGMGNLKVEGRCTSARITLDGMGNLDAKHFECTDVRAVLDGMGNADVFISGSADLVHDGFGDLNVYGNPEKIHQSKEGFGSIHFKK